MAGVQLLISRASWREGAPAVHLPGAFCRLPLGLSGRRPRRGGSPLVRMYRGADTERPGVSRQGLMEGEVQAFERWTWQRTVRPPRWHSTPPPTPESAQGPVGLRNQESPSPSPNSNQMARVENHGAGPGPAESAAAEGLCALLTGRVSQPPLPREHPRGPGAPGQSLGVQAPQGWHEEGVGGVVSQPAPREGPSCPGPTFPWPREPEGIPASAFPAAASGGCPDCVGRGCLWAS